MTRTEPLLKLKPGKEKSLRRRHPWVYAMAIDRVIGHPASGDIVRVVGADGSFLAWAAFSPTSMIRARAWSFLEHEQVDAALITARVTAAVARRQSLSTETTAVRLVFGEADALPGLVVDRYGDQLVVQCQSAGIEPWREVIIEALTAATGCRAIYERSDAAAREREGLAPSEGPLRGGEPTPVLVTEEGVQSQRVLNCFCYTGGFTLAARQGGAIEATSVDSSAEALAMAADHEKLNGFETSSTWLQANVFDTLKAMLAEGRQFDLIVLDPPKFAPSAHHIDRAARAYKEINLKALRLLAPGGLLFTFSCSGAVSLDLFQKIIAGAVFDAGVDAQMLKRLAAGVDHPMLMTHPEGEYLKGLMLRRM